MRLILFVGLLLASFPGIARQLVLVQGYLSQAESWRDAGVIRQLERQGWKFRGEFQYGSDGVRLVSRQRNTPADASGNGFYLVSLPTQSAIVKQAFYLHAYLKRLRSRHPQQPVSLIGHSAGGVVARYVMVRNPGLGIDQLITIASPHLGTDTAELGRLAGKSPLAIIAPFIGGGALNRSQALYADLLPEMPHRFLYWLNRQPHPEAEYISIVRDRFSPQGGDLIVAQESQHLERVYDLRYRARSYIVPGSHALTPADGRLLVDLVREIRVPRLSLQWGKTSTSMLAMSNINNRLSKNINISSCLLAGSPV